MGITISQLRARQVLDSRGNPTIEVDATLAGGASGRALVPSGASTGSHEAIELRDGGTRWMGKGVQGAVASVHGALSDAVVGQEFPSQVELDAALVAADGTEDRGRLGANAILGVSLAAAHATAAQEGIPLWQLVQRLAGADEVWMPVPMLNVINGGEHANNALDVQEFMIMPHGLSDFSAALEAAVATYHTLRGLIDAQGMSTAVGDEGGFAPEVASTTHALDLLVEAITRAGFEPGREVAIALDVAATELHDGMTYALAGERRSLGAEALVDWYAELVDAYPIVSIEDGMAEDDWDGWVQLTERIGSRVQVVGDDLFVTNVGRLERGIEHAAATAILIKPNQVGTLSETLAAMSRAAGAQMASIVSHRSGETEDATIADLAVGTGCGQIKTGAPCRSDRVAKYNQLLRIEQQLGDAARLAVPFADTVESHA